MATLFYDHLIDWQKLTKGLDSSGVDGPERLELMEHAEHTIHTEVLIVLMTHLPAEKHIEFIDQFHAAPHDVAHLQFITKYANGDVENAVRVRTNQLIEEILQDLT